MPYGGAMGRPALGDAARNVVGSTKVSKIEERALIERYGTVHAGLRAGVDLLMTQNAPRKRPKKGSTAAAVAELAAEWAEVEAEAPTGVVPCRIHRNFKVTRRWVEKGQDWTTRRCADCGHEVSRPDHG
jgi:hypothetical protein